ncbi:Z1 domain-containing protein [Plantactinospora endophytica]|uniref:Endonuclease n=1 Tax=Plantactinospora endophytica TaxID=673535 RepID=A0ABQ4EA27_9ACTN|nr:Z1 domain-containing protein [Plantactinospora endophytica]GIG91126.1 endonuclease [Plantactinospora endophytica]
MGAQIPVEVYLRALRAGMSGGLTLDQALETFIPEGLRDELRARWTADRVTLEPVAVLSRSGSRSWFDSHDPAAGYYWPRLREWLLLDKGRTESAIDAVDTATDKILSMMGDPRPDSSPFQVRGLVVGYVQSGKTANFTALIAKAYDAGYRIVIVMSGLHNSLRRQTQLRLEDELGLVPAGPHRRAVEQPAPGRVIVRMTGAEIWQDFHPGTADASLLQGTVPLIFVIKKNASVLRRLVGWLEERQRVAPPVLIIDDEADQASINTGGNRQPLDEVVDLMADDVDAAADGLDFVSTQAQADEISPSVINGLVRRLLQRLDRVSYIGYTATPFANVLINHEAMDREVADDLYPRDFIVSLPPPHGYFGPEKLFGREALAGEGGADVPGLDVIRQVRDHEARLLTPGRGAPPLDVLPASLDTALTDFILAMAARDVRTGGTPASAMLIHGSQYTYQQDVIAALVRERLAVLRQRWRYDQDNTRPEFDARWEGKFLPVTGAIAPDRALTFAEIEPSITRIFRAELPVMVLHNRSPDELDYERNPELRAVVIGGNKLSRGLTIEGLLTSYYVRRANYFDTLLQMGRWFGYREEYVDLTRLWTTADLNDRFRALATAEEDLRREIRLYEVLGKSPRDFAPRIRAHETMQITARNRMGSAQEISYDFSGTLTQTILFRLDDRAWLQDNLDATRRFLVGLGVPNAVADDGLPAWRDIDWRDIERFLGDGGYQTAPGVGRSALDLREYIAAQAKHRELVRWRVAVRARQTEDEQLGTEDLHIPTLGPVPCISRAREAMSEASIGTLVNPVSRTNPGGGDEDIGLTDDDRKWAAASAAEQQVSYPVALRNRRPPEEGLLLLYPISAWSQPRDPQGATERRKPPKRPLFDDPVRDGVTVIGMAVSFPASDSPATVRYVVGSAGPVTS